MFVAVSVSLFIVALGIFAYLFDNFMGVSETNELTQTMAAMGENPSPIEAVECGKRAAGTGA